MAEVKSLQASRRDQNNAMGGFGEGTATVEDQIEQIGFGKYQLIAVFAFICFVFADGMELCVTNITWSAMPLEEWHVNSHHREWLVSLAFFGFVSGTLIGGFSGDYVGRRPLLYIHSALFVPATLISALSQSIEMMLVTRFIVGLSIGMVLPTCVAMIAELTPASQRGRSILVIPGTAYCAGQITVLLVGVYLITKYGYDCSDCEWWRWMFVVGVIPDLLGITLVHLYISESPRYLLVQGRMDELQGVLQGMGDMNKTRELLFDDGKCLPLTKEEQGKDFVSASKELIEEPLVRILPLAWLTWSFLAVSMFVQVFLWPIEVEESGYDYVTQYWLMILVAAVEIPGILAVVVLIDWVEAEDKTKLIISRRLMLFTLGLASGSWMLFHIYLRSLGPVGLVVGNVGIRLFAVMPYKVMYVYIAELVPTSHRSAGLSFGNGTTKTVAALMPLVVVPLRSIDENAPFIFVAICSFAGAVLIWASGDVDRDLSDSTAQFIACTPLPVSYTPIPDSSVRHSPSGRQSPTPRRSYTPRNNSSPRHTPLNSARSATLTSMDPLAEATALLGKDKGM